MMSDKNNIERLSKFIGEVGLLKSVDRVRQHHDEPKFWHYSTIIDGGSLKHDGKHFHSKASGVSFFSKEEAILKVMMEAIERYNNFAFFDEVVSYTGRYFDVKKNAIDPRRFLFFSENQLEDDKYEKFRIDDESTFCWTEVKTLTGRDYHFPCQLIYLSYQPTGDETVIYPQISTGAAAHFTLKSAILNGIYEVLERDAFMIYYMNKLRPKQYDLSSSNSEKIKKIVKIAKRYNLEIYSLDITTDIDIPVVASIVIDRSGLSKAVSVGLDSDLDVEKAIVGSINEAFHTRTWIRESYIENPRKITKSDLLEDSSILNRGLLWFPVESIKKIGFFLEELEFIKVKQDKNELNDKAQLSKLKQILKEGGYEIYYKDITSKYFKDGFVKVVKVIVPGMQPVYLNEEYPLRGGERLRNVPSRLGYEERSKLYTYPHPFL